MSIRTHLRFWTWPIVKAISAPCSGRPNDIGLRRKPELLEECIFAAGRNIKIKPITTPTGIIMLPKCAETSALRCSTWLWVPLQSTKYHEINRRYEVVKSRRCPTSMSFSSTASVASVHRHRVGGVYCGMIQKCNNILLDTIKEKVRS